MGFVHQSVTNLDERSAAEEEPEHVGHDVIADHTGNRDNEPGWEKSQSIESAKIKQPQDLNK